MQRIFVLPLACAFALSAHAAEPVKLWPGKAPGESKDIGLEKTTEPKKGQIDVKRVANVSEPTLTVYAPSKEKNTGTAVVVAPGGGYSILAIEHEGTDVCKWLSDLGVTAVLLKYRVPKRAGQTPDNLAMLQDAQRAVTLVRSMHAELGIDPNRVGMLGFSAGGHLTACTALTAKRMYEPVDKADAAFGHVPNFAILVYPAYLTDKDGKLKPEFAVTKDSPPMFFAHSSDDGVTSAGSVALYMALDAEQGAGGDAPVRRRRAWLRDAQDRPPQRLLARPRRRLDADPRAAGQSESGRFQEVSE